MYLFVCYEKCSTCRKAETWLREHSIVYTKRLIDKENPTVEELKEWIPKSGREPRQFFNTSGKLYRELDVKNRLKTMSEEEIYELLASDGMLVKRPVLVGDDLVLRGFREEEWAEKLI